jgi:zinc D-Ala-D-Ala dipeptidase
MLTSSYESLSLYLYPSFTVQLPYFMSLNTSSPPVVKKPYLNIPIVESGDPLVPIPTEAFVCADPHPYTALGAPYGGASPFFVRQEVLVALQIAQNVLQRQRPAWKLFIFDAYRPVAVQQFMVAFTFEQALKDRGLERSQLSTKQEDTLWEEVFQLWAAPSLDPATPPPHSTGAAVDIALFDTATQETVWMGSPIDELSDRSQPDYFAAIMVDTQCPEPERTRATLAHTHRQLLKDTMQEAGFERHSGEWWHFSLGDQMWAWLRRQSQPERMWKARYGRI